MQVGFGKYATMDVRQVVIKHPDYVKWVLDQPQPTGQLAVLAANVLQYIQAFDANSFIKRCTGKVAGAACTRLVTRGTAYSSHSGFNADLAWWCDVCNPYQLGAVATLIDVRSYKDALSAVKNYSGRQSDYVEIIKQLSQAKGMSKRVTSAALDAFLGP